MWSFFALLLYLSFYKLILQDADEFPYLEVIKINGDSLPFALFMYR